MELEREIYNLLLRKLTNPRPHTDIDGFFSCWILQKRRRGEVGYFMWNNVLTEDIECNAAKGLLDGLMVKMDHMDEMGDLDELIGCGGYGHYNEAGTIRNCSRLKEILTLAEFHSTLINNTEIVEKLNTIISIIKDKNLWKE